MSIYKIQQLLLGRHFAAALSPSRFSAQVLHQTRKLFYKVSKWYKKARSNDTRGQELYDATRRLSSPDNQPAESE